MKQCSKCGELKEDSAFHTRGETGKLRPTCRLCTNTATLLRYHTNPKTKEAHRRASRKYGLKRYGLTEADFHSMHEQQGGSCAICRIPVPTTSENRHGSCAVDHNHTTGAVRGLLCWNCNVGLGKFFDRPELLVAASDYLKRSP